MDERGGPAEVHPGDVMGYHTEQALARLRPLVREVLCVRSLVQLGRGLDVPEQALFAVAGRAAGKRENDSPPIYHLLLVLPPPRRRQGRLVGDLRARRNADLLGGRQRLSVQAPARRARRLVRRPLSAAASGGETFIQRAAAGKLPSVSWIDPSFADLRTGLDAAHLASLERRPSTLGDVSLGQALVLKVYDALTSSPKWSQDAAGDHLRRARGLLRPRGLRRSARPTTTRRSSSRYGVRVPTIVVSPLVGRRELLPRGVRPHLDHQDDPAPLLPARVTRCPTWANASTTREHLGVLLTEPKPRPPE